MGVKIAPPPLRHEVVVVRTRLTVVWVAGHWCWNARSGSMFGFHNLGLLHVPGFAWVDGQWKNTTRGWVYTERYWKKI